MTGDGQQLRPDDFIDSAGLRLGLDVDGHSGRAVDGQFEPGEASVLHPVYRGSAQLLAHRSGHLCRKPAAIHVRPAFRSASRPPEEEGKDGGSTNEPKPGHGRKRRESGVDERAKAANRTTPGPCPKTPIVSRPARLSVFRPESPIAWAAFQIISGGGVCENTSIDRLSPSLRPPLVPIFMVVVSLSTVRSTKSRMSMSRTSSDLLRPSALAAAFRIGVFPSPSARRAVGS